MITKSQAESVSYRDEIYSLKSSDSRGNPHRVRVNGKLKTWKRDTERWELPVKFGLRDAFTLSHWDAADYTLDLEEAQAAANERKSK